MPLFIAAAGNTKEGRKVRKHGADAARKTSKTAKRKVTAAA
jgi:hypothetical protein